MTDTQFADEAGFNMIENSVVSVYDDFIKNHPRKTVKSLNETIEVFVISFIKRCFISLVPCVCGKNELRCINAGWRFCCSSEDSYTFGR